MNVFLVSGCFEPFQSIQWFYSTVQFYRHRHIQKGVLTGFSARILTGKMAIQIICLEQVAHVKKIRRSVLHSKVMINHIFSRSLKMFPGAAMSVERFTNCLMVSVGRALVAQRYLQSPGFRRKDLQSEIARAAAHPK